MANVGQELLAVLSFGACRQVNVVPYFLTEVIGVVLNDLVEGHYEAVEWIS